MRVASRIVGVLLALAGAGFVALPVYVFAVGQWSSGGWMWVFCAFSLSLGIGLVLAAKYFLRLDVDAPDEASRLASYSLPHYPKLKIVALVGLAISLLRLMAAFYGTNWPGRWMGWVLVLAGIGLAARTDGRLNWEAVPQWLRAVMKAAGGTVFMILLLLFAWSQLFQHRATSQIVDNGLLVVLFAWEALFFTYARQRDDQNSA